MPRDGMNDQASRRTPRDRGSAHLRLLLSGDMESPQQVLAEESFSEADKREVFAVWLRDLYRRESDTETRRLIAEIREAIGKLDGESGNRR